MHPQVKIALARNVMSVLITLSKNRRLNALRPAVRCWEGVSAAIGRARVAGLKQIYDVGSRLQSAVLADALVKWKSFSAGIQSSFFTLWQLCLGRVDASLRLFVTQWKAAASASTRGLSRVGHGLLRTGFRATGVAFSKWVAVASALSREGVLSIKSLCAFGLYRYHLLAALAFQRWKLWRASVYSAAATICVVSAIWCTVLLRVSLLHVHNLANQGIVADRHSRRWQARVIFKGATFSCSQRSQWALIQWRTFHFYMFKGM